MTEPVKITDLASLKREKQRLLVYCDMQEERIKDKLNTIKTNYKQIIGEEFLPFSSDMNSKVSNVMDWVNDLIMNKFLKMNSGGETAKSKITGGIIKLAEVLVVRFLSNFLKK
ncbi:MAG: hypothetical protein WAQ28_10370 [Bacteroidia bacterium]|jgi:hypothetical protein